MTVTHKQLWRIMAVIAVDAQTLYHDGSPLQDRIHSTRSQMCHTRTTGAVEQVLT